MAQSSEVAALEAQVEMLRHFIEEKGWCIPGGMPVTECASTVCDCGWDMLTAQARAAQEKVAAAEALPQRWLEGCQTEANHFECWCLPAEKLLDALAEVSR